MGQRRNVLAAGLVALASHAVAQVGSICPTTDVCFKLNIPENTASSGDGDIFFQISAPDTYNYVALGQGSSMSGANIFVVYTAGNGNVTLSPRLGTGHSMPQFNSDAQVTLLEGSGVSNGKMVANVRCSSCNSWSGGSASFSGGNGNWIYATKQSGGAQDTTSQSANIDEHDNHATFPWQYANAKGGNSVNPFVNAGSSGSGSASGGSGGAATSCVPRPAGAAVTGTATTGTATNGGSSRATSTKTDDDDDGSHYGRPTNFPSGWTRPTARPTGNPWEGYDKRALLEERQEVNYCDESSDPSNTEFSPISSGNAGNSQKMLIAHGVLAALAFVIFFPTGAIAIRLASFTGVVWFHAAFQAFAYIVYIAAFGLGVYIASEQRMLSETHPIIGIVVFVVLFFQPILGLLHHVMYKKHHARTVWSHLHLWLGRAAITLGIINGGLGLQLANNSPRAGFIAYGVIAGVVWLVWVAAIVLGEKRRARAAKDAHLARGVHAAGGHYAPKENGT
ncbi:iron reductase domain protein [Karstenula rhodostoma CBS 690.94]|uniref:Iron reductase domain protein n=1 Tax=Karstenula rhodostoma CBS 690.94 TaxID=1392251 RepID=A0A9P4PV98_9PLEO|nr:iron reductase domain protein [Karstenula rhodostoma CBS 690.94]